MAVCNGSIQSSYAIFYLYLNGFDSVYNLSSGFSACLKNNYPAIEYFETLHHIKKEQNAPELKPLKKVQIN